MFELNNDRKTLLETPDHILVLGGPGSGKTTIALLKADHEIRSGKLKIGQRILFLSFARPTVARITQHASKLISNNEKSFLEINTYHGFAWNHLRSHGYLLNTINPIRLIPPYEAASLLAETDGADSRTAEMHRLFKEKGLMHFDLFANVFSELLSRSKALNKIICDTYPIIILDEFQDTNADEWCMIRILGSYSHLIALADAEQRIYEFRGADPKRIGEFIKEYSPTQFDFGVENSRSSGTDIIKFGNDLLSGENKNKKYNDVVVKTYNSFYKGKSPLYTLKTSLIQGINRLKSAEKWSIAVLVPSKNLMLNVSDYLISNIDNLPTLKHDVSIDSEAPALVASLISRLLEFQGTIIEIQHNLIHDIYDYIRGRKGNTLPNRDEIALSNALINYIETGKINGSKRKELIQESLQIVEDRGKIKLSGSPAEDWLTIVELFSASKNSILQKISESAKYLRLLHKGSLLRANLINQWNLDGNYEGAFLAVHNAMLQEYFSSSTKDLKGIHVMTIHKSKGKEFDEVFIYEGSHQGRIVRDNSSEKDISQSRLALRVAVTRAKKRATILTPKNKICIFL